MKRFILAAFVLFFAFFFQGKVMAQEIRSEYKESFYKGEVSWIVSKGFSDDGRYYQTVRLKFSEGDREGEEVVVERGKVDVLYEDQMFEVGDKVVMSVLRTASGEEIININDRYRTNALWWLGLVYAGAIILLGRMKGLRSLIGLGLSFLVLTQFVIPNILSGGSPLLFSLVGSVGIVTVTLYLTHGFSKQTTVSLTGTMLSLVLTGMLAMVMTRVAYLTGFGSEEAVYLQFSGGRIASMRGLLLGGMMIGALGVIDDITVTQAAIVFELEKANKKLKPKELYGRALKVGKEHIASMTNTLILAYAGASLPLFLLFYQNELVPGWVALNSELIAEEIVSTLVGSLGLVASVPITTMLAVYVVKRLKS